MPNISDSISEISSELLLSRLRKTQKKIPEITSGIFSFGQRPNYNTLTTFIAPTVVGRILPTELRATEAVPFCEFASGKRSSIVPRLDSFTSNGSHRKILPGSPSSVCATT